MMIVVVCNHLTNPGGFSWSFIQIINKKRLVPSPPAATSPAAQTSWQLPHHHDFLLFSHDLHPPAHQTGAGGEGPLVQHNEFCYLEYDGTGKGWAQRG